MNPLFKNNIKNLNSICIIKLVLQKINFQENWGHTLFYNQQTTGLYKWHIRTTIQGFFRLPGEPANGKMAADASKLQI